MCIDCMDIDWNDPQPVRATSTGPAQLFQTPRPSIESPTELSYLLDLESPSVMECFKAVEQAKLAIAQTMAQEHAQSGLRAHLAARPS